MLDCTAGRPGTKPVLTIGLDGPPTGLVGGGTGLISCFTGLDVADVVGVTVDVVPTAGGILPEFDCAVAEEVAFNETDVDGGAALTTAGGGGMELESSDDDKLAVFTAADGISTCEEEPASTST